MLNKINKFFAVAVAIMMNVVMMRELCLAQGEEAEVLRPVAPEKLIREKLGDNAVGVLEATTGQSLSGEPVETRDLWDSVGSFKDPRFKGVDVSNWFDMQDIVEPVGVYRYSSFGKPDPFTPPLAETRNAARAVANPVEIPIVSPLQVPLSELRIGGLWELDNGERRALILTAKNQGIIAGIGDPIGLSGKITEINDDSVNTRQYRLRSDGAREFSDVALYFISSEDEKKTAKIVLNPGQDPTKAWAIPGAGPTPSIGQPVPQTMNTVKGAGFNTQVPVNDKKEM